MTHTNNTEQLIEHLFRHESGRMIATLTRIFGSEHLQLAEDVVQETLIKAMQQWSYNGIPNNPTAWLIQVAKNKALDTLRRDKTLESKLAIIGENDPFKIDFDSPIHDDQLAMLFMGCHPAFSQDMQLALLLKTVSGFSVSEIAQLLFTSEATIAQRIVRAKRKIREQGIKFTLPSSDEFAERLDAVLIIIYVIFSEGYKAVAGEQLTRQYLCTEAMRLCRLLLKHPQGNQSITHALMALMLLQASRLEARMRDNQLYLLSEQDRSLWDKQLIREGLYHLEQSQGDRLTHYHLEAGIAACHATAETYEATDWGQILSYYNQLLALQDSAIIALNRLVALAMTDAIREAFAELQELEGLEDYYLYHATYADFASRLGDTETAIAGYERALKLTSNQVEARFLQNKLAEIIKFG